MSRLIFTKFRNTRIFLLVLATWLISCGGSGSGVPQIADASKDLALFELNIMLGSLIDDAAADFSHKVLPSASGLEVQVSARNAHGLKALYFELAYDADKYYPTGVEYTGQLAADTELLTLDIINERGLVTSGQVLANYQGKAGFTGSGVLAVVHFMAGTAPHGTKTPPTSDSSKVIPYFVAPGVVSWLYNNNGDYDQNGEVNISDLTPLGADFGSPGPFDPESALWMVDGDLNGELNISDITPIGSNFGNVVDNFKLMTILPGGEDPLVLGSLAFENAVKEPGRRVQFVAELVGTEGSTPTVRSASDFPVYDPDTGFYWDYDMDVVVVPNDGADDGITSDPFVDDPDPDDAILALSNPPATGTGHFTDPYILYQDDDLDGNPLSFTLTHPVDGDVAGAENAGFYVNTSVFGSFGADTPGLFEYISPLTQTGAFHAYAVYDGELCYPPAIYFVMLPTAVEPPVLSLTNPPAEGSGTEADPYVGDVTTQYIFSLTTGGEDVSTDPGSRYISTPPQIGYISARDAKLDVTDEFVGIFNITAKYYGTANTSDSTVFMRIPPPPPDFRPDALYAFPDQTSVSAGDAVTVVVYANETAGDFQYLKGVGVVFEQGNFYIPGSFNVGDPGGAADEADGVWEDMPGLTGFLMTPDGEISETDLGDGNVRLDFAIAPYDGSEISSATGALFNFQLECNTSWVHLGFDDNTGGDYTYYSDAGDTYQYWSDLTNDDAAAIVVAPSTKPVLSLTNPPAEGSGTLGDPYLADVATDYIFSLTEPFEGDVSYDPLTAYTVSDPAAGSISTSDATLNVEDLYDGAFNVTASYDGEANTVGSTVYMQVGSTGNEQPVANLTADPTSGAPPLLVDFDASGSSDPDGTLVLFEWDWDGDGTYDENTGGTATTAHSFSTLGDYAVGVRVTDDYGDTDTDSVNIMVTDPPVADLVADPMYGEPPLNVNFDASGSSDPDGEIVLYEWDWEDDGTYDSSTGSTATNSHIYSASGSYTACVRVTDDLGATDTATAGVTVNLAPTADLNAAPLTGDTPLLVNFDASASFDTDGTIVKFEWDWEGDATYDEDTGGTATNSHTYSTGGALSATVRVTDNLGGTDTADVALDINNSPVADITADPTSGAAPLLVDFDASLSSDVDGSITNYMWDWESDGTYDLDTGTTPTAQTTYSMGGNYECTVLVLDDDGASATDSISVHATGWGSVIIEEDSNASGSRKSAAIVQGNPFVVCDGAGADLQYASSMSGGQQWNTLDDTGLTGSWVALEVVNSNPAVVYYSTSNQLFYSRAVDPAGTSWGSAVLVCEDADNSVSFDLYVVNGNPSIAYAVEASDNSLAFVRAVDANGVNWGTIVSVDSDAGRDIGFSPSMLVVNGNPAIAYFNLTDATLKFVRAADASGTAWNTPHEFPDPCSSNFGLGYMEVVDGKPAIVFCNSSDDLMYVRAIDNSGTTWNASQTLVASKPCYCPSLAVVDGKPAAAYTTGATDELLYVINALDSSGTLWDLPIELGEAAGWSGPSPIILDVSGVPGIVYYQYIDSAPCPLKFATVF